MKKKLLLLSLIILMSINCFAQFSKTHYIPPVCGSNNQNPEEQFMYISSPSTTPVNFVIKQLGGTEIAGTVSRDFPYVLNIGFGFNTQIHVSEGDANNVLTNKGYIIEAEDVVYVTVRIIAGSGNQAGQITSKGLAALGTQFRIGAFINTLAPAYGINHLTFISILATENNTTVQFNDLRPGIEILNNELVGNNQSDIVLNAGESFVLAVKGPNDANKDGLIGSSVSSNKPIAVNCGSFGGTNGEMGNLDLGFDQIVSAERTGKEYIFIKSTGLDNVERVLLVGNEDNTEVFLNGNTTSPDFIIDAGEYVAMNGTQYTANGNMYVSSTKNIFAYQSVGDNSRTDQANQEMFFVPPLSCQTPKVIDNIAFIEQIGARNFIGRVTLTTETGSSLDFIIDSIPYTLASLPSGVTVVGPTAVIGNSTYECYTITGLTGNVSVFSSSQLYLTAYGSDGAATFGGYYSGFTFKPEINFQQIDIAQANCLPNVELNVSSLTGFDTFQWYFNGTPIASATTSTFAPTQPGYYKVKATLSACGIELFSDEIPVSACPVDSDNDGVINDSDLDYDNDGISNCTESYGNQNINISNVTAGTITTGTYSNAFTGIVTASEPFSTFTGNADGSFTSEIPAGKGFSLKYAMTFAQPVSLGIEYISATNTAATGLLNSNAEYIINSPINNTITVINPDNQLLIDTNYDGFYESGVTQFSSFEVRFILNGSLPLPIGTGTFKFLSYASNTLTFTHKNLSDFDDNSVSLKFIATCIPKDKDNDGIADQMDADSDNDGVLDTIESQGQVFNPISNIDANNDGIDDAFGTGINPVDTDNDGIFDYFDLDSDNDGIYDLVESGSNGLDANNNGILDGTNVGTNGIINSIETSIDSGILNYTILNTDNTNDTLNNYIDSDSDNDGCPDVIEAGFTDTNNDGILGNTSPPTVNANGIVTSGTGYTNPNVNYITSAPIVITTQPVDVITCETNNVTFSVVTNPVNGFQWQRSINNGVTWTNLTNTVVYSGTTTNSLTVTSVTPVMVGHKFRVILSKTGNTCGLISDVATLTTYPIPTVNSPVNLVQCDNDTDGISTFNLTQNNSLISSNSVSEIFNYFTNQAAATNNDLTFLIATPLTYTTSNGIVWVRVENSDGCFRVAQLNLIVSITQIPSTFQYPNMYKCDEYFNATDDDRDGVSEFNLNAAVPAIQAILPAPSSGYTIKFYKNEADYLAETDGAGNSLAISNPATYRNFGYPNLQKIWVRVDSTISNNCFGFTTFDLIVEALPVANDVNATNTIRACDDNQNGWLAFNTTSIQSTILNGQTGVTVTYTDNLGNTLNPLPNPLNVYLTKTITARVTNNSTQTSTGPCYDEVTFTFIVDDLPQAFPINALNTTFCDDEIDPLTQDGEYNFDTSTFETTLLNGQTGMTVYYFDENGNPLPSPLPNPFKTKTQNVTVVVENIINPTCTSNILTIPFIVNPLPNINLIGNELVCTSASTFTTTINAGISDGTSINDYTYQWFFEGVILSGENNYSLTVSTIGTYSVEVTTFPQGCSRTKTIEVSTSEIASIQNIEIIDLSDSNSVEVLVTGAGNYVFAIDDENNYQTSNFFDNIPMGIHTVFVRDLYGCGTVTQEIGVLGIPKYFTPNGDGFNDTWNVKGANQNFYANSVIQIFDRFGKLLKQISPIGAGWDGTFNGQGMTGDDYWYSIKFDDGRSAKGHFTLKR